MDKEEGTKETHTDTYRHTKQFLVNPQLIPTKRTHFIHDVSKACVFSVFFLCGFLSFVLFLSAGKFVLK